MLFVVGMLAATWPMLSSGFALMECDPADTRLINYLLEHDYRWLLGRAELWSPPFFHPERGVAAFTELMLAVVPLYAPWRLLGFEPDTSFQLWMLCVLALNFVAAHALFRRALAFEPLPAAAGAFVVAFGSSRLAQLNHQHLLPVFFFVVAVHAGVRLVQGGPRGWVPVLFAGLVLQFWASLNVAWLACFWLAVLLLWSLAFAQTRAPLLAAVRKHALWLALGTLASGALLAPLALRYSGSERSFSEAAGMVPRLHSWLYAGPHSVLYGWLARWWATDAEGELRLGVGFLTTLVMLLVLRQRGWLRALGLTALSIIALSTMYRGGWSPWAAVMEVVPGAAGIRAVGRIGMLMLFPAGIAVACFAARARKLGWAVVALCLAEQLQRVPDTYSKGGSRSDVARVAAAVPSTCASFFYVPRSEPRYDAKTHLDAMWASLWTGIPTVNGYSGRAPVGWDLLEHGEDADPVRLREALSRWAASRGLAEEQVCWIAPAR